MNTRRSNLALLGFALALVFLSPPAVGARPEPADRGAFRGDTRMTLPLIAEPPTLDGNLAEGEWDRAAMFDALIHQATGNLLPRSVEWRFAWDRGHLYLAAHSPLLKDETLRTEIDDPAAQRLDLDDSYEFYVTRPDGKGTLHVLITARGLKQVTWRGHPRGADAAEPNVAFAVSATPERFDLELALPVAELGWARGNRRGDAWRILPMRNFRSGGLRIDAALPYGHARNPAVPDRHPLMTLDTRACFARVANTRKALYAGTASAEVQVVNPARKAVEAEARVDVHEAGEKLAAASETIEIDAESSTPWTRTLTPKRTIDPNADGEYRYELTIRAGKVEVFHTHLTWNPNEGRKWLGDEMPSGGRRGERVIEIDPSKGIPFKFESHLRGYEELPAGYKVMLTVRRIYEPSKQYEIDAPQVAWAVDPNGQKSGQERYWNTYGHRLLRTVTYRNGVRHGPEQILGRGPHGQYVKTEIPWVDGVVQGVRRVYHPNRQVMTEVRYEQGVPVGQSVSYDAEGRVVRITEYDGGMRNGEMIDYYPRRPKRVVPYRDGEIDGVVKDYWPNGQLKMERPFRRDVLHGVERHYDEEGNPTKTRYWLNGDMVTKSQYRARADGGK